MKLPLFILLASACTVAGCLDKGVSITSTPLDSVDGAGDGRAGDGMADSVAPPTDAGSEVADADGRSDGADAPGPPEVAPGDLDVGPKDITADSAPDGSNPEDALADLEAGDDGPADAASDDSDADEVADGETSCTPQCAGKECGSDGCAGLCGLCNDGLFCTEDSCGSGLCTFVVQAYFCVIEQKCVPSGAEAEGNSCQKCKPADSLYAWSPVDNGTSCGTAKVCWNGGCCDHAANCQGKECGDDGCGGTCGQCPYPKSVCGGGKCQCTPDCWGKECGSDGCGGYCGSCVNGDVCSEGQCSCPGVQCGSICCPPGSGCSDGQCM